VTKCNQQQIDLSSASRCHKNSFNKFSASKLWTAVSAQFNASCRHERYADSGQYICYSNCRVHASWLDSAPCTAELYSRKTLKTKLVQTFPSVPNFSPKGQKIKSSKLPRVRNLKNINQRIHLLTSYIPTKRQIGSGGSSADCKLDLSSVRPSLLLVPKTLCNWTDGRIHVSTRRWHVCLPVNRANDCLVSTMSSRTSIKKISVFPLRQNRLDALKVNPDNDFGSLSACRSADGSRIGQTGRQWAYVCW